MDDSLTAHLLSSLLPTDLVNLINTHVLDPRSPLQALKRHASISAGRACGLLLPLLQPLADRLLAQLDAHRDLLDALVPLLVVVAAVVVLNWIRRIVMWGTRLAMRAVMWAVLAALAAWVWNRGLIESARDAAVLAAKVVGYAAVVRNVWLDEYKRYEGQQASGRWDEYAHTQGPR